MNRLLLVEDDIEDVKKAADVAESLGICDIQSTQTLRSAMKYLESAVSGAIPLPDCIVLDLDLELDSGFELLRYWYKTPQLARIPVVVWSVVDELGRVCRLFKVDAFVSKSEGTDALRRALERLASLPVAS
jgi:CheY-like chemotaxis protein